MTEEFSDDASLYSYINELGNQVEAQKREIHILEQLLTEAEESAEYWEEKYRSIT